MRLLRDQHAAYADRVNFLLVTMDLTESSERVESYRIAQGYPWPVAVGTRELLETYRVAGPAIKYGVDREGVITFQRGYGVVPSEEWAAALQSLAAR